MRNCAILAFCCLAATALGQNETSLVDKYTKDVKANPRSSANHFRLGELYFFQHNYQSAANEFREALSGDLQPGWVEVWSLIRLGNVFDMSGQRDRAINQYRLAKVSNNNTRGAQDEVDAYLAIPFSRK